MGRKPRSVKSKDKMAITPIGGVRHSMLFNFMVLIDSSKIFILYSTTDDLENATQRLVFAQQSVRHTYVSEE